MSVSPITFLLEEQLMVKAKQTCWCLVACHLRVRQSERIMSWRRHNFSTSASLGVTPRVGVPSHVCELARRRPSFEGVALIHTYMCIYKMVVYGMWANLCVVL